MHGMEVQKGLRESEAFPGGAIYTPSTKAEAGKNDENIHPDKGWWKTFRRAGGSLLTVRILAVEIVGEKYAKRLEELSLSLYSKVSKRSQWQGLLTDNLQGTGVRTRARHHHR